MAILMAITVAAAMVAMISFTAIWRYQSIWDAAGTGVSATGMYTVSAGGWNSTGGREVKSALAFIVHIGDKPVVTGMDTYCEVSSIRRSLVDPKWEVLDAENMPIKGVGSGLLGPRVKVPYRHRFNMQAGSLGARIMDHEMMPDGLDVMMGTIEQLEQAAKFDAGNERLELWAIGATIVIEEADVLKARINSRPLNVLEACVGMSGSYAVFRDLGYSIDKWHTIENEDIPNAMAGKLYAGRVRCVAGDVSEYSCKQWYDVFLAGPPCQPWSRRAGAAAKGFRDARAEPFRQCCRILAEVLEVNKDAVFMFENVVVSTHLQGDAEEQERLLNWEFELIDALDLGAPQSRPRKVAQNLVEAGEWEHRPPVDPNLFLEKLGSWVNERHTKCVLASGANTGESSP